VRNIQRVAQIHKARRTRQHQGESEAHNLAEPGDVLVIEGSWLLQHGGQSPPSRAARIYRAIVDGTCAIRAIPAWLAVWCKGFTPITGKWRMQTIEVNGPCSLRCPGPSRRPRVRGRGGRRLRAARAGCCGAAWRANRCRDTKRKADIDAGAGVAELMTRKYK